MCGSLFGVDDILIYILIYSDSIESHYLDVRRVLQQLHENGLFCKLEKCEFHLSQVAFLVYIISTEGFSMDSQKVLAVLQWPRPSGLRSIQHFLGFTNYYRKFISNFSSLAKPILNLTKRGSASHNWTPAAIQAFEAPLSLLSRWLTLGLIPTLVCPLS